MKRKIGNSWGWGLYMTPLEQKFRGVGGSNRKNHPWEGYGYFLESHIVLSSSETFEDFLKENTGLHYEPDVVNRTQSLDWVRLGSVIKLNRTHKKILRIECSVIEQFNNRT